VSLLSKTQIQANQKNDEPNGINFGEGFFVKNYNTPMGPDDLSNLIVHFDDKTYTNLQFKEISVGNYSVWVGGNLSGLNDLGLPFKYEDNNIPFTIMTYANVGIINGLILIPKVWNRDHSVAIEYAFRNKNIYKIPEAYLPKTPYRYYPEEDAFNFDANKIAFSGELVSELFESIFDSLDENAHENADYSTSDPS
jgi:hypothetical protein